jgi:hypothetical protein
MEMEWKWIGNGLEMDWNGNWLGRWLGFRV